ncbi:Wd repeat-containing protein 65, partial [Globisporangium splendens]
MGQHVVIYNLESNSMEFFHHTKAVQSVQCFNVSPNRELIAIAEIHHTNASPSQSTTTAASGSTLPLPSPVNKAQSSLAMSAHLQEQQQQHVLCIYKTASRSHVRSLLLPHHSSIVSCSFSTCNKFLALLEDAPTHNVTYWKVSNTKLLASCKCPSRGSRIHIHPQNPSYISVSGSMVLKYWIWSNSEFKIGNFVLQLREHEHFVDHVWMKEYMVALSEKGLLLCFRATTDFASVDLVHSYRCHHLSFVRMECITAHAKGFVLGGSAGFFSIYETSEDPKDPFAFVRNVSVGDIAFESIAISPSVETVVVCTKSQELLTFNMSAIDTVQEDRVEYKEFTRHGFQVGGIVQVDICIQRPILVSCGTDKSVRVWNYELRHYEVLHACSEEPLALGLHPCGFQLIVAFKERVRVYTVLVESLRQNRELAIKSCRAVRYARGGHLVACAAGLMVLVLQSYTLESLFTFAGHIGAVHCLAWSKDDFFLYSAAHDGAVYRWNITTGCRSDDMQHVVKQCQYTTLVVDERDAKVVVAAGSDGKLREIVAGEETKVLDLAPGVLITSLALTKDNKRLFAGTNIGSILVYAWPLSNHSKSVMMAECFGHSDAITHMCMTQDNESLITCSEDSSIAIFKLNTSVVALPHADSSNALEDSSSISINNNNMVPSSDLVAIKHQEKKKAMVAFMDTMLVAREDLDERHAALVEWKQRYEQVQADAEFALHRKENEWIDRLRVVKDECEQLVVQERLRYEELESRYQHAGRKHIEELAQKENNHVNMIQELENQYERKLAHEIARYDTLSETLEQTRQRCEALIESQDTQHRSTLHVERKASYVRTKEQNEVIKRLHDDLKYNHVRFEEVLHQEETEYEQELHKMCAEYEKQLKLERQNTAIKQGHLSATNTKLESLKKKIQELKASSYARDILLATEKAKTTKFEATLSHYEKHFETCTFSLADKDKAIQSLKSSNRVLENFRSVLHYRIDNLEIEKVPMQEHMHTLESHIAEMQTELFDEFKAKAATQKDAERKDAKVKMLL